MAQTDLINQGLLDDYHDEIMKTHIVGGVVFDISAYHASGNPLTPAKYADLAAALGTNGANIPVKMRKGGMSIKFVSSSDNKYVSYRYMSTSTANADIANVANWQGVDEDAVEGSHNLVESGSVAAVSDTVKSLIGYEPIHTNRENYKGSPSDNGWFIGLAKHILIPVTAGEEFYIKPQSSLSSGRYCFLSVEHIEPVTAQAEIKFASGTGTYNIQSKLTKITIPQDAAYLCLVTVYGGGEPILWEVDKFIENPFILTAVNKRIDDLSEKTDEEYKELKEIAVGDVEDIDIDGVELGTIGTDGTLYPSNEVGKTVSFYYADKHYSDYVKITGNLAKAREVIGNSVSVINVNVHCYNKDKTSIGRTSKGYQHVETNAVEYPLRDNTYYIKLTMSFLDSSSQNINISSYISAISSAINDILSIEKPVLSLQKQIDSNRSAISSFEDEVSDIADEVSDVADGLVYVNNKIDGESVLVDLPNFEMGYISTTGEQGAANNVCRSASYIDVQNNTNVIIKGYLSVIQSILPDARDIYVNIHCYDANKTSIGRTSKGYQYVQGQPVDYTLRDNTRYIRITMSFHNSNNENINFNTLLSDVNQNKDELLEVTEDLLTIQDQIDNINKRIPSGNIAYYNTLSLVNKSLLSKETITGLRAGWEGGNAAQGHAVYNNYLFQLRNGGHLDVYTLGANLSPSYVKSFDLDSSSHCNNVQFSTEKDTGYFPYLYVAAGESNKVEVFKIDDSLESATKVQTITLPVFSFAGNTSYMTIGEDGCLWGFSRKQGTPDSIVIIKTTCPSVSQGDVSLTESDVLEHWVGINNYDNNQEAYQGTKQYGNKFYYVYGGTYNRRGIKMWDINTHALIADIELTGIVTEEFEDMDIVDDYILLFLLANKFYKLIL